jgi:hypothetical protein
MSFLRLFLRWLWIIVNNIYNFNKIGFAIGIIATIRVIIMFNNVGKPVVL